MAAAAKPSMTKQLLGITLLLLLCVPSFVRVDAVAETPVFYRRMLQASNPYAMCAGGKFPNGCSSNQSCYDGKTCTTASSCCTQCQRSKYGGKRCCGSLYGISCLAV
ncbi:hypothetical protein M758_2G105900 [Ceratodon purpureus]|nr:hypothetical protein M758_2G105900 [Ceratodon purpureus]